MSHRRRPRAAGLPPWWSPERPFREVLLALAATPGPLPAVTADRLAQGLAPDDLLRPDSPDPARVAATLEALGQRFVLPGDPAWPLAATPPEPPCAWLFVAGTVPPGPAWSVAVVGGRRASPLRLAVARSLGAGLARAGRCVVSGGAAGADAAAHHGALDAGGRTVAVLGCGLEVAYPRSNAVLFHRILEAGGGLVGEHPPGGRPRAAHFPPRNRLISALAGAVVVVEAGSRSGSLTTARAAGGRGGGRLLAVPGAPWDQGATGCNDLIRDGATLVRGLDDVLAELELAPAGGAPELPLRRWPAGAGPAARAVLDALVDGQVMGTARLAALTGLPPEPLAVAVVELELAGFVRRLAGGLQAVALPLAAPRGGHGPPVPRPRVSGAAGPGGGTPAPGGPGG
ncbi:MAG TPA: DNA-processing protein DprA [Actinomycetota bacterium]|nr:DNA-processing protein DprA [Actinomycetota bacterium]